MTDAPKTNLKSLSNVATQGDWFTHDTKNISANGVVIFGSTTRSDESRANARYVATLVNMHRSGQLAEITHSDALVAAAYEDAAHIISLAWTGGTSEFLRTKRTTANAQAAYDAAIAQARREGWEAGRSEAVVRCHEEITAARESSFEAQAMSAMWCKQSIQALEYKEPKAALSGQDAEGET